MLDFSEIFLLKINDFIARERIGRDYCRCCFHCCCHSISSISAYSHLRIPGITYLDIGHKEFQVRSRLNSSPGLDPESSLCRPATAGDIFSRTVGRLAGSEAARFRRFWRATRACLPASMTLGLWIGVDKILAPFREIVKI